MSTSKKTATAEPEELDTETIVAIGTALLLEHRANAAAFGSISYAAQEYAPQEFLVDDEN